MLSTQKNSTEMEELSEAALLSKLSTLEKQNAELKKQIEWLKEQFKLTQAKKFAGSTESSECLQFDLFADNESEEQERKETEKETIT